VSPVVDPRPFPCHRPCCSPDGFPAMVVARFWGYVQRGGEQDCWLWTAGSSCGYGAFSPHHGHTVRAHRFAYELLIGPIPDGLVIDHLCRVKRCVNPAHLEPVTFGENVMRGETLSSTNAAKTHCNSGHALDEANTYVWRGWRRCRLCNAASVRRSASRKRAVA
jgi:hypothetical protein